MTDLIPVAVDFESFYSKEISIVTMGGYAYTRHPKTRPYMVSVVAPGMEYVGSVDDFDWNTIAGPRWLQFSHNRGFDELVYQRLHEEAPTTFPLPANPPQCSADLCAFVGLPRALAGAVYAAFGETLSKSVRDKMKGRMPEDLTPEEREDLRKYALDDSIWALKLWQKFSHRWPENERRFSLLTRRMGWHGLPVDAAKIEEDKKNLSQQIWEARSKIPWAETAAALSPKQLAIACREAGIPAPSSLAMDSEECEIWEDTYGDKFPWVDAMRKVRRCNALLKKLESMEARVKPDGRMNFDLKYCGAHTKRDSGGGGVNVQNLTAKELFGVDLRSTIVAPEGKVLAIADLAQIEPRCGAYLCGDKEFLASLAAGVSPYIIHARQTMGLGPDEVWPKNDLRYKLAKARVLGLGYGCGHRKFLWMATNIYDAGEVFDQPVTEDEHRDYAGYALFLDKTWHSEWQSLDLHTQNRYVVSKRIVDDYREKTPRLASKDEKNPGMWKRLGDALRESAIRQEPFIQELPSGNTLTYRDVRFRGKELVGRIVKNGQVMEVKLYGGLLYENLTQSVARDVFRDCVLNVTDAGYNVILRVHDELVTEVDEDRGEATRLHLEEIMGVSPSWAKSLPVAAEAQISKHYCK